jgi:iron complex outermembrane receptor protein
MRRSILMASIAAIAITGPAHAQTHAVESVVVTASPIHNSADDLASIPASVNAEQILRSGGASLADALANIPGISGSGFSAGSSRPVIRGMDATRVRVLENGTSSSDASDIGPDHGVPIDPLSARSIEVVRGAATLRYGSQAIGGVVNAINNRIPLSLPEDAKGEVSTAFDSVSDAGQVALLGEIAIGKFAIHADGFYRGTGDYDTPLGPQANSFFKGDGVSLGSSYFLTPDSRIGAAVVHYDSKYGIPGDVPFIDMRQTKYMLGSSLALGDGLFQTLNIDGSYGRYAHHEKDPDENVHATFRNKELDLRAETLTGAIGPLSSAALGIEIQNRDYAAEGHGADYLLPTNTRNFSGFLFTETNLTDALHLEASARAEQARVEGIPASNVFTSRSFTPVSGALGLLWETADWVKLGFTTSSTARAPAQTELFARGAHDGSGTFETGNPGLSIERANSVEATVRLRFHEFSFDGSAYANWFDNYIYGVLTGQECDEDGLCGPGPAELRQLNYAQAGAYFRGLEGKMSYDIWHSSDGVLQVSAMGDYVRATLAGGGNVPRIPPYRFGGGLSWESERLDGGFQVLQVGEQSKPGLFDTATPGYISVDAQIAWRPVASNPDFELALIGRNLADEVARNAASFNKDRVVSPGRNIRLVARLATN